MSTKRNCIKNIIKVIIFKLPYTPVLHVVQMIVNDPPQRFVDSNDNPIESIEPEGSRYEQIDIKKTDDEIEVRAKEAGTDRVTEFTATLTDQMFRGVELDDGRRPHELDEDFRAILQMVGYQVVDRHIKGY